TDAGLTWDSVARFPEVLRIEGVWGAGQTWVAVGNRGAIFRSTDGGGSWAAVRSAGETNEERGLLAVWGQGSTVVATGGDGTILRSTDAGQTWVEVNGPTPEQPAGPQLYGVRGAGSTVLAVGTHGTILRSADAGETWETIAGGVFTREWPGVNLMAIWGDEASALALGNPSNLARSGPTLLRSTDDGETWEPLFREPPVLDGISGDSSLVLGVGRAGAVLRSTDGGASWARLDGWERDEDSRGLWDVWAEGSRAVAVGMDGAILRSNDAGVTWTRAASPTELGLYGVWGEGSRVVAVGLETILRSTDGGATFTRVADRTDCGLLSVSGDGDLVVAVGAGYTQDPPTGAILRSTDGGTTWSELAGPTTGTLVGVWVTGSTVVGVTGDVEGGQIVRSTDAGETWDVAEGVEGVSDLTDITGRGSTLVAVSRSDILVSNDTGATWSVQLSGLEPLMAVFMPDPHTLVAGGTGVIVRGTR
ncbi:MAG: WD40/YVTN/BNR-like repeat-containing protein, partial [Gemmatimonadota bacterium]